MTTADNPTDKPQRRDIATRFKPGHVGYRRKAGDSRLTVKAQRKRQAKLIGDMLMRLADDQAAGIAVDPLHVTRLVHTHMLLLREL
jgi:hypothetical protein